MITIDDAKCTLCQACLKTCHTKALTFEKDKLILNYRLCSTCTHCIAICPERAVSWNHIPPQKIDPAILPTSKQMRELLQSRRSIFHYEKKKIDRRLLKEIVRMGKYSPTNNYDIEALVVDDEVLIKQLESLCIKRLKRVNQFLFKPRLMRKMISRMSPEIDQAGVKIEEGIKSKRIFHRAPALIIAIADSRIRLTELSVQYFLYNVQLYASTLGIGSRVNGGGKRFLARSRKARKLLNLEDRKSIQGILTLGYPLYHYVNKAEGVMPKIHFCCA